MSCIHYINSCGKCNHFIKTLSVEYEEDVLILTIPAMKIKNHDKICLCIVQDLPVEDFTPDTTVIIYVGDSTVKYIPITRLGNLLYADALKTRKVYPLYTATDTKTFVLQDICKLGNTDHVFPIELPATKKPS